MDVAHGEERETAIGMTGDTRLLSVTYVFRAEGIRLISARTVTNRERSDYEEQ